MSSLSMPSPSTRPASTAAVRSLIISSTALSVTRGSSCAVVEMAARIAERNSAFWASCQA